MTRAGAVRPTPPTPTPGGRPRPRPVPGVPDELHVTGIRIECVIGFRPKEREVLQPVDLDLVLVLAQRPGGDEPAACVDYRLLKDRLRNDLLGRRFRLLEALAEEVAALCLEDPRVEEVQLTAHKPGALTGATDVAVRIRRRW